MTQIIQFAKRQAKILLNLLFCYRFQQQVKKGKYNKNLFILMYHRVLPKGDPRLNNEEPGMYVTPETLEIHLNELGGFATFITIEDWIHRSKNKQLNDTPYVAITFDDGWADNYEFALPLLNKIRIPASIFLATNYIGSTTTFWPERLYRLLNHLKDNNAPSLLSDLNSFFEHLDSSLDLARLEIENSDYVAQLINLAKALTDDEINSKLDLMEASFPTLKKSRPDMLSWQQVRELHNQGIEIGGHTRTHLRLNFNASEERIKQEVAGCAQDIITNLGTAPTLFCYPNGDICQAAINHVEQNYQAAVTTQNGVNKPEDAEPFLLKRIGVHQDASDSRIKFLGTISKAARK